IDAACGLVAKHRITLDHIRSVAISASTLAVRQSGNCAPTTLQAAQSSSPFSVALALVSGQTRLRVSDFQQAWSDPKQTTLKLAARIRMLADEPQFGFMGRACEVRLELVDGRTLVAEV